MLSTPTWTADVGTRTCLQLQSKNSVKSWGNAALNFQLPFVKQKCVSWSLVICFANIASVMVIASNVSLWFEVTEIHSRTSLLQINVESKGPVWTIYTQSHFQFFKCPLAPQNNATVQGVVLKSPPVRWDNPSGPSCIISCPHQRLYKLVAIVLCWL